MTDGVKLFRRDEAQFAPGPNGIAAHGLINAGFSKQMGAGVGVFDKCSVEWTLDYDEVLFIIDGKLRLHVAENIYEAVTGDVLWIPAGTAIVYEAEVRTTFFYAVSPVQNSISTSEPRNYPESSAITS